MGSGWDHGAACFCPADAPGHLEPFLQPWQPGPARGALQSGSFTRSLGLTLLNFLKVAKGPTHTTSIF